MVHLSRAEELPEGFLYQPNLLALDEEANLVDKLAILPLRAFDFHGFRAKRRVVEYGREYDFDTRKATAAAPLPDFLVCVCERAAAAAGIHPQELVEAVVTEYPPGAPIGWHRDVPQFEAIVGVSLVSSCRMRLRPYRSPGRITSILLEPRSVYLMRGPARWQYQHSIPGVQQLRYSITFRTLRRQARK
jgi:alkylated DNA repair dioxygenase AlkB